jgi:hypothetical protein
MKQEDIVASAKYRCAEKKKGMHFIKTASPPRRYRCVSSLLFPLFLVIKLLDLARVPQVLSLTFFIISMETAGVKPDTGFFRYLFLTSPAKPDT